jgi:hypothetical protein
VGRHGNRRVGFTTRNSPYALNFDWLVPLKNSEFDIDSNILADLSIFRCADLKIRGSYYHGHEYSFIRDVILTKGVKQDLAWIRFVCLTHSSSIRFSAQTNTNLYMQVVCFPLEFLCKEGASSE